jgi:hypothetical protein
MDLSFIHPFLPPQSATVHGLDRLSNRLTKIIAVAKSLGPS